MTEKLLAEIEIFFVDFGLSVVGGAVFLVVAWVFAIWVDKLLRHLLARKLGLDATLIPVVAKTIRIVIVVLAAVAVLQELGIEVTSLIAALGIFGFAIAIGMRTQMANFFTGVMILILKPYHVGEYIDGERVEGAVESVGLFHTTVITPEGVYAAVPSAAIWSKSVLNLSRKRPRQVEIEVRLERNLTFREVGPVLENIVRSDPDVVLEHHPRIKISDVSEKYVTIRVAVCCRVEEAWNVRQRLADKFRADLVAMGITVIRISHPDIRKRRVARKKPEAPESVPDSDIA